MNTLTLVLLLIVAGENFYFRNQLRKHVQAQASILTQDWVNIQTVIVHLMQRTELRFRDIFSSHTTSFTEFADNILDSVTKEAKEAKTLLETVKEKL